MRAALLRMHDAEHLGVQATSHGWAGLVSSQTIEHVKLNGKDMP